MFRFTLLITLVATSFVAAQEPRDRVTVLLNGHTFTLPKGFTIEVAAKSPQVDRPISADFDERGRLYVSDSSGSNEKVAVQLEKKPHRIVRLESTKGDGVFDKSTVFADKMMFPEGTMYHRGSLYVAAPPHIIKLTDTGTGKADKREIWFDGKTLTGCANDLHGPYLGPDGRIYWCKGAFAPQTYELPGNKKFQTRAAHVFRARLDGTGLEPVMTGGMDNPVDLVFTPTGERIFTTTFFQFPGGGQRDGLVHAVYGGIYGKDWEVIRDPGHRWTGPHVLPVLTQLGPAAPCGLHRYESSGWGSEYQDNIFACLFNLQKVTRHVLIPDGASFKTRDEDFLVSDNKDFHPTDVIEDADGSLLVIDTGGWYKLCCPTSQLVKPDVLGAIYRVRKVSTKPHDDPYGLRIDWDDTKSIARCLADPRAFVRKRAIDLAGQRGDVMLPELTAIMQTGTVETQRNALWAATRIISVKARAFVRDYGLAAKDASVVRVALHSMSVNWDVNFSARVLAFLQSPATPPAVLRVAAEAMGRIYADASPRTSRPAAEAIFDRLAQTSDRVLEHSLTYALIEMNDRDSVSHGLDDARASVRRAALVVLDQIAEGGKLEASVVVRELSASDPKLRETAWWIASRHPEWSASLGKALRQRLAAKFLTEERRELIEQLAKLSKAKATQALLVDVLGDDAATVESRIAVLHAMAQSPLKEAPPAWLDALRIQLNGDQPALRLEAARALRSLRLPKAPPADLLADLRKLGEDAKAEPLTRLTALSILSAGSLSPDPTLFGFLLTEVNGEQPVLQRSLAAEVLSKAKLDGVQLAALATNLPKVGPMEVDRLLDAFAQTKDDKVGAMLVKSLQSPELRTVLREDAVKLRLAKFSAKVRKDAEPLLKTLNADTGKQQARLEDLLTKLPAGDVRRGMTVFNHAKSACMACHAIGYVGGKTGPDLTRIGSIRTERDLLESIIFPSASFVRGYEPIVITTKNGLTHNGLVRKNSADELHLAIGVNQDLRVSRTEIEEIRPSRVSIMPAGLDQQLTLQQLADLIAFLKACR